MIGGKVIDVWKWHLDYISVVVEDNKRRLGVMLEKNDDSLGIMRGDFLWWQGSTALWTSKDHSVVGRHILKMGWSFNSMVVDSGICPEREKFNRRKDSELEY